MCFVLISTFLVDGMVCFLQIFAALNKYLTEKDYHA